MIFDVKTCKRVVKINTRTNMGSTISPHASGGGNIGKQRSIIRASLVAVRKLSRSRLYLDARYGKSSHFSWRLIESTNEFNRWIIDSGGRDKSAPAGLVVATDSTRDLHTQERVAVPTTPQTPSSIIMKMSRKRVSHRRHSQTARQWRAVARRRERERTTETRRGASRSLGTGATTRDTKIGINEIDTTLSYSTWEARRSSRFWSRHFAPARLLVKKSAPNDALDPRRPTRYAPAVDRRVARFNNDLREPVSVLRKVTLRKKERRTSQVTYSGEAVLASTYFRPHVPRWLRWIERAFLFILPRRWRWMYFATGGTYMFLYTYMSLLPSTTSVEES